MLVYKLNDKNNYTTFEVYNEFSTTFERNKLDIIKFEIPKDYRYLFFNEQIIEVNKQFYIVKNIEDLANTYRIECHQDIGDWYQFNTRGDYPYKKIDYVLNEVKPIGWQINIVGDIKENRTIKAEHRQSFEILEECIKKYDVEYRLDNYNKILTIGKDLGSDLGSYFMSDFNINKQDINVESFEFATRIIPEGMNGLKINQINDGKDYLENNSYSDRLITYYWKDERYTNIQNLKNDAQKKLDILSRPTLTIELEVQDLNSTINAYKNEYKLLDYVWLIDSHRKVKEKFKIIKAIFYEDNPLENEIILNNKPQDLIDDEEKNIELTEQMWEYTRTQFEAIDGQIRESVETSKRYTDDSFKTYKTERIQTDNEIRESITESTTYVDPETGQTKPIVEKAYEIVKDIDGVRSKVTNEIDKTNSVIEQRVNEINLSINSIEKDVENKVDADKIISQINLSREGVKISGDKIDVDTLSLNLKVNEVTTYWSRYSDKKAIHIAGPNIELYNEYGNTAGGITTGNWVNTSINNIRLAHYPSDGTMTLSYRRDSSNYTPYITFDKYNLKERYPITIAEDIDFGIREIYGRLKINSALIIKSGSILTVDGNISIGGNFTARGNNNFYNDINMNSHDLVMNRGDILLGNSGESFSLKYISYTDGTKATRIERTSSTWFEFRSDGVVAVSKFGTVSYLAR
ncbi:phage tail protein [uncultured Anaerococcus sp.]|uniref:phage tail protein n=1 Tax=uncultured Anaerococcus sp. TaxID=293428 RepID=UPI0026140FD1|nr:phage tail protein [uncultured Anaerococcus sp.]